MLAVKAMEALNVGAWPIVEGARATGVITDRDIVLRGVAREMPMATTPLGELMEKSPSQGKGSAASGARSHRPGLGLRNADQGIGGRLDVVGCDGKVAE